MRSRFCRPYSQYRILSTIRQVIYMKTLHLFIIILPTIFRHAIFHSNALFFASSNHVFNGKVNADLRLRSSYIDSGCSSDSKTSVHMGLVNVRSLLETKENLPTTNSKFVDILEFYNESSNDVLAACVKEVGLTNLEHFSMHLFNKNLSREAGVSARVRSFNLSDNATLENVVSSWRQGSLVAPSKDFPYDILNASFSKSMSNMVRPNSRRIKTLLDDRLRSDFRIRDFLSVQSIGGRDWIHFAYDKTRDKNETLVMLKIFSEWFRKEFPYYYDSCVTCGTSKDTAYYGTVFSSPSERQHNSARTELYYCGRCTSTTRFPRFNEVVKVLETRRGRCGEYSVLLMRMLLILGYPARWVNDCLGHVWTEAFVDGDWVHMDPCEAAVNEPLIYEAWGKEHTLVLAYDLDSVADVTVAYTSAQQAVAQRRNSSRDGFDQESIDRVMKEVSAELAAQYAEYAGASR